MRVKTGIEERVAKRARRNQLRNIVLASAYVAVAAGMMVMTPNAMRLLKHVEKRIGPLPNLKRRISQTYSELIARGVFKREVTPRGLRIVLTEKGAELAAALASRETLVEKPKRWDKKWRIIMFDVWERRRSIRDQLRRTLEEFGFVKIQNSVWAHPYPCEKLLIFLRAHLKLGKGILYIVAEEVEQDEQLRRHFQLPLE